MMKKLIMEYRRTRRITSKAKQELSKEKDYLATQIYKESKKGNKERIVLLNNQLQSIEDEIQIRSQEISSLNFAIEWMSTCRQPGTHRGVENRAAYDREVPFENSWIERRSDHQQEVPIELTDLEMKLANEEQNKKKIVVRNILKSLTPRQIEILELIANGYNQSEIARILGISQQSVSETISRYKNKIKEDGWFML